MSTIWKISWEERLDIPSEVPSEELTWHPYSETYTTCEARNEYANTVLKPKEKRGIVRAIWYGIPRCPSPEQTVNGEYATVLNTWKVSWEERLDLFSEETKWVHYTEHYTTPEARNKYVDTVLKPKEKCNIVCGICYTNPL